MQARTELQHVWAVKSHDLMYKPLDGNKKTDQLLLKDMKLISDSLNIADRSLDSIRIRVDELKQRKNE
jgi:ppGpp synthetase/RelA/SpoT-type nucleotidyltranferase